MFHSCLTFFNILTFVDDILHPVLPIPLGSKGFIAVVTFENWNSELKISLSSLSVFLLAGVFFFSLAGFFLTHVFFLFSWSFRFFYFYLTFFNILTFVDDILNHYLPFLWK